MLHLYTDNASPNGYKILIMNYDVPFGDYPNIIR